MQKTYVDIDHPLLNLNDLLKFNQQAPKQKIVTYLLVFSICPLWLSIGLVENLFPSVVYYFSAWVLLYSVLVCIRQFKKTTPVQLESPILICGQPMYYTHNILEAYSVPLYRMGEDALRQKQDGKVKAYLDYVAQHRTLTVLDEQVVDHYLNQLKK